MNSFKTANGENIEFQKIIEIIQNKLYTASDEHYVVIGCDSQKHKKRRHIFVLAIAIVNTGHGGIYFIKKWREDNVKYSMAEKLYREAGELISLGEKLIEHNIPVNKVELHLDLSNNGKSKKFVPGITGMCSGYGFLTKIKNESWCSNGLADKFSKTCIRDKNMNTTNLIKNI